MQLKIAASVWKEPLNYGMQPPPGTQAKAFLLFMLNSIVKGSFAKLMLVEPKINAFDFVKFS